MKVGIALRELHGAETELAEGLLRLSERHKADHDVYHLSRDLADWSVTHVRRIAEAAQRYGEQLDPTPVHQPGAVGRLREAASDALRNSSSPALALLHDLRDVYLRAEGVSVDWELVAQAAQGIRDHDLLGLTQECHAENLRQAAWANSKLKESATQILLS